MKLQILQNKMARYYQILKYYGLKLTCVYFLAQKSDKMFYDFRRKILLDFVLKLRKEAQLVDSSNEKEEETTEFPKIIWTMWQQGEAQMPETVQTSPKEMTVNSIC